MSVHGTLDGLAAVGPGVGVGVGVGQGSPACGLHNQDSIMQVGASVAGA